jgi:thiol-disulfide isomerase/thioredoxin
MAVVALLASSGGYFLAMALSPPGDTPTPVTGLSEAMAAPSADGLLGQPRPDFTLFDTNGLEVSAGDFDGNVLLVNFWATWCSPCVEEMPMLSGLQQEYAGQGVKFLGIALDDAERARQFAADLSIQYPVLVGQADVVLTGRRFGNTTGMLPFSVLVDASGIIRWTRLGALNRKELEAQIHALR